MKLLITENRLKELFDSYMDRLTKDLIRVKDDSDSDIITWSDPDSGEYDMSFFDYEPDYEYYEEKTKISPKEKNRTILWMQCDVMNTLTHLFPLDEKRVYKMIKDWAETKYNIKITKVTCQG